MVNFEKELIEMARNVKFRKGFDDFQLKMKTDLRNINSTQKVFVQADKTSNMYKLTKARKLRKTLKQRHNENVQKSRKESTK